MGKDRIVRRALTMLIAVVMIVSFMPNTGGGSAAYAAAKKPARVSGLTLHVKGTSVRVKWKKAKKAKRYRIRIQVKKKKGWRKYRTGSTKKIRYRFKAKSGSTYRISVRGIGKKKGKWSAWKIVKVKSGKKADPTKGMTKLEKRLYKDEDYNYKHAGLTIPRSYFFRTTRGYSFVKVVRNEYGELDSLRVYDLNQNYVTTKRFFIRTKYPLFGTVAYHEGAYYVITGQENPKDSKSKEVIRVTKYNGNGKEVCHASVSGGTAKYNWKGIHAPFSAGACRVCFVDDSMYIQTSRHLFKSSDGVRHQANLSLRVDLNSMRAEENIRIGGVGHSFNQFIKADGENIVTAELCDACPERGFIVMRDSCNVSISKSGTILIPEEESDWYGGNCVFHAQGKYGDTTLMCDVKGLEIGQKNYLVCGTSVIQDKKWKTRETGNVILCMVDRNTQKCTQRWLTSYKEGTDGAGDIKTLEIGDNTFIVIWQRKTGIYWTIVDDSGKKLTGVFHQKGALLSDCTPILAGDKVRWVVTDENHMDFYSIDVNDPGKLVIRKTINGIRK